MIKIFNADDTDFSSNGNVAIKPLKLIETKKKSLNGWFIDVEIPIEYKEYIDKSKLFVVKTKSKLNPQAFFIDNDEEIQFTDKKITFRANHVAFKASNYLLIDVRPTDLNGAGALDYINTRLDRESPFTVNSDVENVNTAYFIRKTLLEALEIIEERWGGSFDIDNWNINLKQNIGLDRGEIIAYGKNLENIKVFEDWSNVVTKLYPVGKDGLMLPEKFIETEEVEYEEPYVKTITFETDIENEEEQTEEALITELRYKAEQHLYQNQFPMVSYEITSDINQLMEIGDTIHVKHPLVDLQTEVLGYEYNILTKRVKKLIFGNYTRDVKKKFDAIKEEIKTNAERLTSQEAIVKNQTNLINSLNKNGIVYIDDNEILVLDKYPREEAKNVWRLGLGGFGFSSNGYDGDYELAMTQDGRINADFITAGTLEGSLIKAGSVSANKLHVSLQEEIEKVDEHETKILDLETSVEGFSVAAEKIEHLTNYIRNVGNTGDNIKLPNTPRSSGAINTLRIRGFELKTKYKGMQPMSEYGVKGVLNFYTLIFDTVPTFDGEPNYVFVNSPLPLNKLGDVYDELLIESNKIKVIQRIGYDFTNEQWGVLSTPITHELNDVLLPTFDGDTFISVKYFDNLVYNAEYLIKNDLTSNFATQLESSSQFKLNQDEISSKVNNDEFNSTVTQLADGISSKVSKGEIVSEINQSEEQVKIEAERIKIEGLTTINENFKVLLDGSIEAVNAKLTGDIFLPNGGRVIGGDGILGNLQYEFRNYSWMFPDGSDTKNGYYFLGYNTDFFEASVWKNYIMADIDIPENFTVTEAKIKLLHANVRWDNGSTQAWGYCRNLRAYKVTNANNFSVYAAYASGFDGGLFWSKSEISNAFGSSGFTAPVATNFGLVETESADISSSLNTGNNKIIIQTANSPGAFTTDPNVVITRFGPHTGYVYALINIKGYMKI